MNSNALSTTEPSQGREVAGALRTLLDQLEAELRHPELAPRLSSLAIRGVTLATGWSLAVWRDRVDAWCARMEHSEAHAAATHYPEAGEWIKRLGKLRSFLVTAGQESRRMGSEIAADPDANAVFGDNGQNVAAAAAAWFTALDGGSTPEQVVVVQDLTKRYGPVTAVDGVSLTIPKGQIFGLLGPNSAGKTTLIECIEGIRSPDSGSVSVLGLSYRDRAKELKTRVGVQLQTTGFYELLTLRETLKLYASFFPRPVDVDDLMTRLSIRDKAKTLVKDLSGGIRQRMSLAVALVNDPELIFLDEPTTGLDPQARHVVWEIVRSLREAGATVMLTTHYMDEAEQLCDRVAIMTAGQIRVEGSPGDLIGQYVGETVVDVALAGGFDDAAVRALPGIRKCISQGERLVIQADDPSELLTNILALPRPPAEVRVRRGTLEDVFLIIAEREEQP